MRVSKLERYYQAEFGPRDDPGAETAVVARLREPERRERRRGGFGRLKLVLLCVSGASLAASWLMPCGVGARPGFLPQGFVSTVCARQQMFTHALGLQDRFRSIAGALR